MDDKLKQSSTSNSRLPPPSMDIVREFLQYQVWGAEPEDVQRTVVGLHGVNPYRVSQIIAALEQCSPERHPELARHDRRQPDADERCDDDARAWLRDLAAQMGGWTGG